MNNGNQLVYPHSTDVWNSFQELLNQNDRYLISSHINPDGDAVGSSLAFKRLLDHLGKDAQWLLEQKPDSSFDSFYYPDELIVFDPSDHTWADRQVMVMLDASNWKRLGEPGPMMERHVSHKLCIDHHQSKDKFPGVKIVDVHAPSTTVLVYRIIKFLDVPFTLDLAEPIYLGLMTDTQNFSLPNTTIEAHQIAAECLEVGVHPEKVHEPVFGTLSFERMHLMSMVFDTVQLICDGKVGVMYASLDMFQQCGADQSCDEGFSDMVRMLKGVKVGIYIRELEDHNVKVSWRAKGSNNVEVSARHFGGGGHIRAAGALFRNQTIDQVMQKIIAHMQERYENQEIG